MFSHTYLAGFTSKPRKTEPWQALGFWTAPFTASFLCLSSCPSAYQQTYCAGMSRPMAYDPSVPLQAPPSSPLSDLKTLLQWRGPPGNSRAIPMWQIALEFQDNSLLSVTLSLPSSHSHTHKHLAAPPPIPQEPPSLCFSAGLSNRRPFLFLTPFDPLPLTGTPPSLVWPTKRAEWLNCLWWSERQGSRRNPCKGMKSLSLSWIPSPLLLSWAGEGGRQWAGEGKRAPEFNGNSVRWWIKWCF